MGVSTWVKSRVHSDGLTTCSIWSAQKQAAGALVAQLQSGICASGVTMPGSVFWNMTDMTGSFLKTGENRD